MSDSETKATDAHTAWQHRLLPVMVWMLVGLTAFFFLATLGQLLYLNQSIQDSPPLDSHELLAETQNTGAAQNDPVAEVSRLRVLALLESNVVARRYHQASVTLMAAMWAKYLGFMTGMTLSLVGATFVLGQLRTPGTNISGKTAAGEITLNSASPGLVLAVLGALLMITTIVTRGEVAARDVPVYLGEGATSPVGGQPEVPCLDPQDCPSTLSDGAN